MDVAVIGGGHGCYAAAIELTEKGHSVRLWRRDAEALAPVKALGGIEIKDRQGERTISIDSITADLSEAVSGAQLLVMPLPATTHDSHMDGRVRFLTNQRILCITRTSMEPIQSRDPTLALSRSPVLSYHMRPAAPHVSYGGRTYRRDGAHPAGGVAAT